MEFTSVSRVFFLFRSVFFMPLQSFERYLQYLFVNFASYTVLRGQKKERNKDDSLECLVLYVGPKALFFFWFSNAMELYRNKDDQIVTNASSDCIPRKWIVISLFSFSIPFFISTIPIRLSYALPLLLSIEPLNDSNETSKHANGKRIIIFFSFHPVLSKGHQTNHYYRFHKRNYYFLLTFYFLLLVFFCFLNWNPSFPHPISQI